MTMAYVWQAAQPALLYLVPATLLPVLGLGAIRGELSELWHGSANSKQKADNGGEIFGLWLTERTWNCDRERDSESSTKDLSV
jgi:hypothetical protein